jgi:hypothetical protein
MLKTHSLFDVEDLRPKNNSKIFNLINPAPLDSSKKTVLIITFKNFNSSYNHIYGFFNEVINVLKDSYNIIYAGKEIQKNVSELENFYLLNTAGYNSLSANRLKRKKEESSSVKINQQILWEEFDKAFGDLQIDRVLFATSDYFVLPLTTYFKGEYSEMMNEFHDYVGNDSKKIHEIHEMINSFCSTFDDKVSLLAYTMYYKNIFMNLPIYLNQKHKLEILWGFSIDPVSFMNYFSYHGINHKRFYFVDDKRGTRNYDKFPIAQLQHLIHENRFEPTSKIPINKTKNFFFMGTIFQDKGNRRELWYQYLDKLTLENSSIWVPLKLNGIIKEKKDENSKYTKEGIQKMEEKYKELVEDVKNHSLYSGHLLPNQIKKEISAYKYGLVIRCISNNDSLNFRPILYTHLKILPLLDPQYDPSFLQIPQMIQEKLLVKDHFDIQNKIKYFNQNPTEREKILDQLNQHFQIQDFQMNWKNIINSYLS